MPKDGLESESGPIDPLDASGQPRAVGGRRVRDFAGFVRWLEFNLKTNVSRIYALPVDGRLFPGNMTGRVSLAGASRAAPQCSRALRGRVCGAAATVPRSQQPRAQQPRCTSNSKPVTKPRAMTALVTTARLTRSRYFAAHVTDCATLDFHHPPSLQSNEVLWIIQQAS